jgi:hypothetical protein
VLFAASLSAAQRGEQPPPTAQDVRAGGEGAVPVPPTFGGCPGKPGDNPAFHKCALERIKTFNPPRTSDGRPDMQGIWRHRLTNGFSVEGRADREVFPDRKDTNSLILDPPDGKLPLQPWAVALSRGGVHYRKFFDPHTSCRHNPGRDAKIAGAYYQMLQPPGDEYVIWMLDESHQYRIIDTSNRQRVGKDIKLWMGTSYGRWEGNTLVVENTNLNGNTWLDDAGDFYSDTAVVTERWTLIDADTIHLMVTVEDPRVYTRPFTMVWALVRDKTPGLEIMEDACREGDKDLPHFLKLGYRLYFGQTWRERVDHETPPAAEPAK